MSNRGVRDRYRRDYPSRSEEKSHHGRGNAPPSRNLWVGNLPHTITESDLAHHFLEFGELESVSFQPARSYAFINFANEEDAFVAIRELQGFVLAGNPLRIEFTKGDSRSQRNEYRDEQRSMARRSSPFPQRDPQRYSSPDPPYMDENPKSSNPSLDPSEVLWIGFPAQLKVDDFILRKNFSPFGEIDKISVFPGRPYAFVRFRNVMSAIRAKDALHGKLFGNPRVSLTFAKNETGSSSNNRERNQNNDPHFREDRHYNDIVEDRNMRSHDIDFRRRDGRFSEKVYSPSRRDRGGPHSRSRGGNFRDYSPPPLRHPPAGQFYDDDDTWDLPDDVSFYHGSKKQKTGSYPPENELLEYPFSEKSKRGSSRAFIEHPQPESYDMNSNHPYGDRYQVGPVSLQSKGEWKRPTSEAQRNKEWKWEGTIAKGGTPVCRARCFPVGKTLEMPLPEYIDCTARTSLDMLAKHYYQATSAFVVFFVPANDPDISYYNEFMNYLGDKQRAAVAKLDDFTTLFLVPPSDFSEKVLKVPGRLSVSGVVLRLDQPGNSSQQLEKNHRSYESIDGEGHEYMNVGPNWSTQDNRMWDPSVQESSLPRGGHQAEQLGQLASSLMGQMRQTTGEEFRHQSENSYRTSEMMSSQYGQVQQHQYVGPAQTAQKEVHASTQVNNQQSVNAGQEEDPQTRLQATLQLAAALLQQIQGKGT